MNATLEILDRLVGFDTVSARSNLELVEYAEAHLNACGFRVRRLPDPDGGKAGLYAEIGPPGAGVLLSGHTDVVPVEGQVWSRDPFRLTLEGNRAYGRGTTDMKGFVASALALAQRAAAIELAEPLKIVLSYDEEVGCVGIARMLDRLAPMLGAPRACIVGEPTRMQVATGHKGKVALRAICTGQAGHSALAPRFVNALHLAAGFVTALRGVQNELATAGAQDPAYDVPCSTVHVGTLHGGRALNIVPDRAEMMLEFRHLAADRANDLMARIRTEAHRIGRAYGDAGGISVEQINAYPGLDVDPADPVVAYVRKLSGQPHTTKVAFGTEAGFFHGLGIPTVVCGPGSMEGQGHKPDEYVTLEQLAACDAMMDRLLDDLRA